MKTLRHSLLLLPLLAGAMPAMAADVPAPGEAAGLPQFDPHWWPGQIFWLAVFFFLLYGLMAMLVLPRIGKVLDTRAAKVAGDLAEAEKAQSLAAQAQEAYQKLMAHTRIETTQLLHDAGMALKAEAEKRLHDYNARGETEMKALEQALRIQKQKAKDELQSHIAELASAAATKIVGLQPDIDKARTLVQGLRGTEAA